MYCGFLVYVVTNFCGLRKTCIIVDKSFHGQIYTLYIIHVDVHVKFWGNYENIQYCRVSIYKKWQNSNFDNDDIITFAVKVS